ncbi:uncharacterized protein LOC108318878 [Vigna angularis]|uniref:uncharacterized protein LOC108318878 n=1 Tax=Phaseolus angularis TaxID=3914 RepID=UPI00080A3BFA|nr:uncharacterized protein LOC108318878 [Vigna angularis]
MMALCGGWLSEVRDDDVGMMMEDLYFTVACGGENEACDEGDCLRDDLVIAVLIRTNHYLKGEASWNIVWDMRPARWLHRLDSAWLHSGMLHGFWGSRCHTMQIFRQANEFHLALCFSSVKVV